jgi:hypothetical protein
MFHRFQKFPVALAALLLMATISLPPFAVGANMPTVSWSQLSPTTTFPPRSYAAVAYDAVSRKIVLFGGFGSTGYLNDTWTFDGTNWAQVTTLGRPGVQVAAITRRAEGYFIVHVDSGKENDFPQVNGVPIGPQARRLNDNDVVQLAGVKMGFFES